MNIVHEHCSYKGSIQMPKIIENIREVILENGKQMLLEGKYSEFNLRTLAKKCGLGLGTFYNYFSSKEDLAFRIFMNDWDKTLNLVDDLKNKNLTFKEKLFQINQSLERFLGQYIKVFREIAGDGMKSCPVDYYEEIVKKLGELVEIEKKSGTIKSEISSDKLAYFILLNMFECIKNGYMNFEELFECMRI
jgi:AcrR family transcriptional regulator